AVMYYLLTGDRPFKGDTALQTIRNVTDEDPVPPRQVNPEVSAELDAICLRCMEKEPSRRFASAADLALALTRTLGGATADIPGRLPDRKAVAPGTRW